MQTFFTLPRFELGTPVLEHGKGAAPFSTEYIRQSCHSCVSQLDLRYVLTLTYKNM